MNKPSPLISIIIPLYNTENYIADTLNSIAKQTYKNYEVIVVDNASTDSSVEIVNSYTELFASLKVIRRKENSGGPAAPRNVGIENAKGEYVAFLDSDDVWHSDKLEKQVQFMIKYNYNFSSTAIVRIDGDGKLYRHNLDSLRRDLKISCLPNDKLEYELFKNNFITLSSTLIKKEFLELFNEEASFIGVEDYQLWFRLINKEGCRYGMLPELLVDYRVLHGSISHLNRVKQGAKALLVLTEFLACNQRSYMYYAHFALKSIKLFVKSIM